MLRDRGLRAGEHGPNPLCQELCCGKRGTRRGFRAGVLCNPCRPYAGFWLHLPHQTPSSVRVCPLRAAVTPPQASRCLFPRLALAERAQQRRAGGTCCLEQFWEAVLVLQPPQAGKPPEKCSFPACISKRNAPSPAAEQLEFNKRPLPAWPLLLYFWRWPRVRLLTRCPRRTGCGDTGAAFFNLVLSTDINVSVLPK